MKPRIYIDTSVIGGCLDEEFASWSNALFEEFRQGSKIAVLSDLTMRELVQAPERVRQVLTSVPPANIENVLLSEEADGLARRYIDEGAVNQRHVVDAQHIAIATIARVDVLVSWNFQQIVNLKHVRAYNSVSLKSGYPMLEIRSPREVIHEEEV
jgi:hypothetical protein